MLWYARELYGQAPRHAAGKRGVKAGHADDHRQGHAVADEIAAFLNEHRAKNRVVPADLARCLTEAEKQVPQA